MRRLAFAVAVLCILAPPAVAKDRIANRGRAAAFDPARPSAPLAGWPIWSVTSKHGHELTWKLRLVTLPDRPFTDPVWLSTHSRLTGGSFDVIVWRWRPPDRLGMSTFTDVDSTMFEVWPTRTVVAMTFGLIDARWTPTESLGFGLWCPTQTVWIPAQPNQLVEYVLDMNAFNDADSIMFELWPGYDVWLDAYDRDGNRVWSNWVGYHAPPPVPWAFPIRSQLNLTVNCGSQ